MAPGVREAAFARCKARAPEGRQNVAQGDDEGGTLGHRPPQIGSPGRATEPPPRSERCGQRATILTSPCPGLGVLSVRIPRARFASPWAIFRRPSGAGVADGRRRLPSTAGIGVGARCSHSVGVNRSQYTA